MSLETLLGAATEDLRQATAVDPSSGLARLKRTHRRRRTSRLTALAVTLVLAGSGTLWSLSRSTPEPEPVAPLRPAHNGALVSVASGSLVVVDGELDHRPTDLPQFPRLTFSGDGHELLYLDDQHRLVAFDHRTGTSRELAECADQYCDAAVSPDKTRVALAQQESIVVQGPEGTSTVDLPGLLPFGPAWSPDGTWLAFGSHQGLYVMRADGTDLRQVDHTVLPEWSLALAPAWSPDGRHLAFLTGRPGGSSPDSDERPVRYAVTTVDLSSGERRTLTGAGACFCTNRPPPAVAWSPDGRLIGFVGTGDRAGIFAVPATGGAVERMSTQPAGGTLAWQPLP